MNDQIFSDIETAIRAQQAKGVRLTSSWFGVRIDKGAWVNEANAIAGACACALGCYLLEYQPRHPGTPDNSTDVYTTLSAHWGDYFTRDQFWAFIDAFDKNGGEPTTETMAWYDAGKRLRAKFLTK